MILCNKCGKSCSVIVSDDIVTDDYCCHVGYSGGYCSYGTGKDGEISDGDSFRFVLCERCLAKLMKSFKIPPRYSNFLFSDKREWRKA